MREKFIIYVIIYCPILNKIMSYQGLKNISRQIKYINQISLSSPKQNVSNYIFLNMSL